MGHLKPIHATYTQEDVIQARRAATETPKRLASQNFYKTVDGVITVTNPNGTYNVKVAGRAHDYTDLQCIIPRVKLEVGQGCVIGFLENSPNLAMIIAVKFVGKHKTASVVAELLGGWDQSNCDQHGNTLGASIASSASEINDTASTWTLPTTDTSPHLDNDATPYGLARAHHEGEYTHYLTAWPRKRHATGLWDYCIGAWDATSHANQWTAVFSEGDASQESKDLAPRSHRFFYSQADRYAHALIDTDAAPRLISAKSETVKTSITLDKPCNSASIASFTINDQAATYLIMPHLDEGPDLYTSAKFYTLSSNSWTLTHTISASQLVNATTILEAGHDVGGPVPWDTAGALIFASGGNEGSTAGHWTQIAMGISRISRTGLRSLYRASTSPGAPTELTQILFSSAATSTNYISADTYNGSAYPGAWLLQAAALSTAETYGYFQTPQIQLPAETPNTLRMGTFGNHVDLTWPPAKNALGGPVYYDGNLWLITMDPQQVKHGGHYEERYVRDQTTYKLTRTIYITWDLPTPANTASTGTVYSFTESTTAWDPGTPGDYVISPGASPPTIDDPLIRHIISSENVGEKEVYQGFWVLDQANYRRTNLRKLNISAGTMDTWDLSHTCDADHSVALGRAGTSSASGTVESAPIPDNIWKMILIPSKDAICLLRDLRTDGPGGNPSPNLEIRSLSNPNNILSTTPLGTQDLLSDDPAENTLTYHEADSRDGDQITFEIIGDDYTITSVKVDGVDASYTLDGIWLVLDDPLVDPDELVIVYTYTPTMPTGHQVGDRAWNQYWHAPRMKAVADLAGETNTPCLQVAIFEEKRVLDTESGFKRVTHHKITIADPENPVITTYTNTSADVGAGSSENPGGDTPLANHWDTLTMNGKMTWIRNSQFNQIDG